MNSLTYLNKYLLKYKVRLALGTVFIVLSNLFAIYPAQVIREAFDEVAGRSEQAAAKTYFFTDFLNQFIANQDLADKLLFFGALVLIFALLKGIFTFLMRQTVIVVSRYIEFDLKGEVYEKYQTLNNNFYKRNNTGDLMNRISEDVSRVRMYLGPAIMYTINLVVLFILVISTMISVNPKLTLYVLTPLPILSFTIYFVSNVINRKSESVQHQLSILSIFTQEAFSGIRVIKAYNRENSSIQNFREECNQYKDKSLALVKVNALFHPFMILLIGLSTLLTVYFGGIEVIAGNITNGNIAEFIIYVNMLTWPVASLGWVTSLVQRAAASQTRINEFLNEQTEQYKMDSDQEEMVIRDGIAFENVSFTYKDSGIVALNNVTFKIPKGNSLAVLGKTGSGKSTLVNLICRLYNPDTGTIELDGEDITGIAPGKIRKIIGYVPQDVFLFSDTIANNIAFGNVNSKMSDIQEAARKAVILRDIEEFSKGLETVVGERGITLSGGQKQRVAIARAIIKEPLILIFDDCLSAVDTETEEAILNNLNEVMKDRTSIIVSHRVSSVKNANNIIVLDQGAIKEQGSHLELMELRGLYYELYQKQLLEEQPLSQ
ncbi:MAG TPA: ABC transporter ATP-binding protein [Flavobacteriales bacterium]|nr:ABC transporter ATP-binding protein [Flavobacteriales bacterium]HIA11471.1 ABC transporter ATP-binding protein [Flavobacteriales bacterium]HIO73001.1 ABC transporter ATP-binding protein [Flavobacteriales bacterium]